MVLIAVSSYVALMWWVDLVFIHVTSMWGLHGTKVKTKPKWDLHASE